MDGVDGAGYLIDGSSCPSHGYPAFMDGVDGAGYVIDRSSYPTHLMDKIIVTASWPGRKHMERASKVRST